MDGCSFSIVFIDKAAIRKNRIAPQIQKNSGSQIAAAGKTRFRNLFEGTKLRSYMRLLIGVGQTLNIEDCRLKNEYLRSAFGGIDY